MTYRQAKIGRAVRITDDAFPSVLRSCGAPGKLLGAGGAVIPDSGILRDTGSIAFLGSSKQRALVTFPRFEFGIWIDLDRLEPAPI